MHTKRLSLPLAVALGAGLLAAGPFTATTQAAPDLTACPWMDTTKTAAERATLLLDASSPDQTMRWLDEQSAGTPSQTVWTGRDGSTTTYATALACTPSVVYTDGPDVVRHAGATLYPAPIALASSWDLQLSYDKGAAFGQESVAMGYNGIWAPGVSSSRVALAGRTPEYLGEDSLLSGLMAGQELQGMNTNPLVTGIKHYVANEQEANRQTSSSNVSDRALHEVYSLPFEIAIDTGQPDAVMCSYNQVNGVYACENPILNTILKGDIGFDGFVVSDFGAVHSTAPSLNAGLDMELNAPNYYAPQNLQAALDAGQISEQQIKDAAYRVVKAYFAAGVFDTPLTTTPTTAVSSAAHKAIAKQMAQEGSVLLKNDSSTLPLVAKPGLKVAIIGGVAGTQADWVDQGYSLTQQTVQGPFGPPTTSLALPFSTAEDACSESGTDCSAMVSPLESISAAVTAAVGTVTYTAGDDIAQAQAVAKAADVALVFGYLPMGEGSDATSLSLSENGDALITAVADVAPRTVALLETGSATDMPWLNKVDSVVEAWYPGEQAGPALSDLLFGQTDFSGKLPMTFPVSMAKSPTPTADQYPGLTTGTTNQCAISSGFGSSGPLCEVDYSEDLAVGYKWYDATATTPLFPFGYGLSYTTYGYSNLSLTQIPDYATGTVELGVSFDLTNTGTVAGTEIPQVYLTLPTASGTPGKRLVSFDRVSLAPGETTHVSQVIDSTSADHPLSVWDETSGAWSVVTGQYGLSVGSSSRDLPLTQTFDLSLTTPDKSALQSAAAAASALVQVNYTPASWAGLAAALAGAQASLANANALQADVDQALATLQAAVKALVAAPATGSPSTGSQGTSISTGGQVSSPGMGTVIWVALVVLGFGAAGLSRWRRVRHLTR